MKRGIRLKLEFKKIHKNNNGIEFACIRKVLYGQIVHSRYTHSFIHIDIYMDITKDCKSKLNLKIPSSNIYTDSQQLAIE